MAAIHYVELDRTIKKNLKEKKYSSKELGRVYEKLKRDQDNRCTGFKRAAVTVVVCIIVVNLLMLATEAGGAAMLISLLFTLVIGVGALGISWILTIGLLKMQFNRAIEQYYPEFMGVYRQ